MRGSRCDEGEAGAGTRVHEGVSSREATHDGGVAAG